VVISLERGADLHTIQLMPLLLTVSCFSKIQIGFIFQVPAHLGSPGQRTVKRVCVCVCLAEAAEDSHYHGQKCWVDETDLGADKFAGREHGHDEVLMAMSSLQ